jgi:hypothetical protein
MEEINIEKFKKEWFNFEEIKSIKRGLDDVAKWRTISKSEMNTFIKEELFSKYTTNA